MSVHDETLIQEFVRDYAVFHQVETDEVSIVREYEEDSLVSFVLSLDKNDHSAGKDERYFRHHNGFFPIYDYRNEN